MIADLRKQEEVKVCEAYTNNNGGIMEEREVFTKNTEFVIYPISDEDRSNYTELHKQLNGEKSLYLNPRSKDMMWEQTLNGTDRIFSLYTVQGDYCGSVELQKPDSRTPEIGIDLLESRRNMGIALKAVPLFAKKIYEIKDMDYFIIRISSNNAHSKHVFEKMGAVKIGEEETDFQKFAERFGTTIEKKGQDLEQYRNLFDESDDETVYRYKLEPEVLLQY